MRNFGVNSFLLHFRNLSAGFPAAHRESGHLPAALAGHRLDLAAAESVAAVQARSQRNGGTAHGHTRPTDTPVARRPKVFAPLLRRKKGLTLLAKTPVARRQTGEI